MGRKRRKKTGSKKLSPAKLKSDLIKHFLKNPKKRLNAGQLAKKLKITDSKNAINYALESLMKDNLLRHIADGRYVLNKKEALRTRRQGSASRYEGTVSLIRSGSAYIIVEALDKDVYVPASLLAGAMNGDFVEVAVRFLKFKNPEGRVVKVLKRNTTKMAGLFQRRNKYAVVRSTNPRVSLTINIKKEHYNDAKDGDRVLVHITKWRDEKDMTTWGQVKKVFRELDDHEFTMESILVENGFSSDYPPEVMKETNALSGEMTLEEIENRRDFRDVLTFTIDPDTAQDFDDALSYKVLENGDIEVGVHIADVTHYVTPRSALDKEAFTRSTSVYLVDRCIAMLPEKLSNDLCSLKPEVDRFTFSAVFTFDKKNQLVKEWFGRSVIHSDKRFTYEDAQLSLDNVGGLYHKELTVINKIAYSLRDEKFKNGAINFETDEVKFLLGDDNKPTGVFVKSRKDAHMLIEDFMLLANKRVAHFISTKSKGKPIPFIYRIHDLPDLDRLADLTLFMRELGINLE
ncbi:MAG: RNB domain-containing ribonuclease [Saprospiraceae bacterium]|nr:RNB domain-containing ribonuclease [Saprospiraceae bacterium]